MSQLKDEIYNKIKNNHSTSFIQLSDIEGFKGEYEWIMAMPNKKKKIMLWAEMSKEAINSMMELFKEKKITPKECGSTIYLMDGGHPETKEKNIKWVPVVWDIF